MKTLVFESYPNNEVRVGWNDLPTALKTSLDTPEQRENARVGRQAQKSLEDDLAATRQFTYRDKNGTLYRGSCADGYDEVFVDPSKLDIISEVQDSVARSKRKDRKDYTLPVRPTAFTRSARHTLLEGGQVFENLYSLTHTGYFVTFTLPGSSLEAYDAISRWSGYLANRVLQCVRDNCPDAIWFYCWELQKRGALHLHLFLGLLREQSCVHVEQLLRDVWYRCLQDIQDADAVDMFKHKDGDYCTISAYWQFDFQQVEKSPAAYLSKYVGKHAEAPGDRSSVERSVGKFYPQRWWGMCRVLRWKIDEARFKINVDSLPHDVINQVVDEFAKELSLGEPVATQEYSSEVKSSDESKVIGVIHRRIFWFKAEDFPIVDVLFRVKVVKWLRNVPKHLRRFWYDSLRYQSVSLLEV